MDMITALRVLLGGSNVKLLYYIKIDPACLYTPILSESCTWSVAFAPRRCTQHCSYESCVASQRELGLSLFYFVLFYFIYWKMHIT
jgi:hypothetical protein